MAKTPITDVPTGRAPFVYLDFCFFAFCNFTCSYCRDSNRQMSKGEGRPAFDQAVRDFLKRNSAGVLKLSGYGEATLWPELADAVGPWAPYFPSVQLISNGAGPRRVLEQLCELPNFQACITLDGHTPELDRFRTKGNPRLHGRVLDTISWLVSTGVKVELNCVVTQANAARMDAYLSWASETWGTAVRVIPFPVRPTLGRSMAEIVDQLVAPPTQVDRLEEALVTRHGEFAGILPPLAYTARVVEFMRAGQRGARCHVHRANFGINPRLQALACACAGDRLIEPLGPVGVVGTDPAVERRRHRYLLEGNVGAKCRTCFTHYDLINLYLDGLVSDEEIGRIPSLSEPGTLAHLRAVKRQIRPYL